MGVAGAPKSAVHPARALCLSVRPVASSQFHLGSRSSASKASSWRYAVPRVAQGPTGPTSMDQAPSGPLATAEGDPSTSGRRILFAVDGTEEAEEALRWVVKQQVARKGDTVHLGHVICDPRTPSTAVGSSAAATQWSPARDEAIYAREFFLRMEHEAQTMMNSRFVPSLQFTGVSHSVDLLRLRVHKSAAGIGEALAKRAQDVDASLLIIASHGAGVLADYGSVARWCSENSHVPTLLIPPAVLRNAAPAPSNTVVVAAADDAAGLRRAFDFALAQLVRPGDNVYVMHAVPGTGIDGGVAARKQLVADVLRWQEESPEEHSRTLNIAVDVIAESTSTPIGDDGDASERGGGECPAGAQLCTYAADLNARAVVLAHHGSSMMREMMCGPLTAHCTKHCNRPLLVLGATAGLPGMSALGSMD